MVHKNCVDDLDDILKEAYAIQFRKDIMQSYRDKMDLFKDSYMFQMIIAQYKGADNFLDKREKLSYLVQDFPRKFLNYHADLNISKYAKLVHSTKTQNIF